MIAAMAFGDNATRYTIVRELYQDPLAHRAIKIGSGNAAGVHFKTDIPICAFNARCPSYSNDKGSLTLALYTWAGSVAATRANAPIATRRFVDFRDCALLTLDFPPQSGELYAEVADGDEAVGVWETRNVGDGSECFLNGTRIQGSFEFSVTTKDAPFAAAGSAQLIQILAAPSLAPKPSANPSDETGRATGTPFTPRDLYADTWDAVDGLERVLGDSATLPAPRDKKVGIFYWTWHQGVTDNPPHNNAELIAAKPSLVDNPDDPGWGKPFQRHHWDKPIFDYYMTTDPWVVRRHAQLLAEAQIDAVVFDATNGNLTWMDSTWNLLRTWSAMRRDGFETPRFVYMLPFFGNPVQVQSILQLYRDLYKPGKFRDLWFDWQGKPLIHAEPGVLKRIADANGTSPEDRAALNEILRFFTFRPLQPAYAVGPQAPNQWCWLEVFPQHAYGPKSDGTFEFCAAGVAQNHTWRGRDGRQGLAAMNDINVFGRAYMGPDIAELRPGERLHFAPDRNPKRDEPNRFLHGDNFAQQMRRARAVDPDYLFVTGWNEWVAGLHPEWMGTRTAFPDQYAPAFSRDIEPSSGILKDHFYYQLVQEIRRFKGVRPQRACGENPIYRDARNDTLARDAIGYGGIRYTDNTGRNDLIECAVSHDDRTITFSVTCADTLTPHTDKAWMRLLLSLSLAADDPAPHWNRFHFMVNRLTPPDAHTAILEVCEGGWNWREVGRVPMAIDGKTLTLTLPRKALGLEGKRIDVRFKWADNTPGEGGEGEILDFYRHGDTAPDGRFLYRYFERP